MTTPTTNFGWVKSDPGEKASIVALNSVMDDMDADIKTVSDAKSAKIYSMGQWQLDRRFALLASGSLNLLSDALPDSPIWEERWKQIDNTGNFTVDPYGAIRFTQAGIYRVGFNATIYAYGTATTSGYVYSGLYTSTPTVVPTTGRTQRLNTRGENPWCTITGNYFLSTAVNISTGVDYFWALAQHTSGGAVGVSWDPDDQYPFDVRFSIECIRSL